MSSDKNEPVAMHPTTDTAVGSRRKFLKGGMALAAGSLAAGFPMISTAAKPVVLKLQGA